LLLYKHSITTSSGLHVCGQHGVLQVALAQLGVNPSKALGCCWRQREIPAKTMAVTHRERRTGSCQP